MPIHVTPIPKVTNFAAPTVGLSASAAEGSAQTVIRSDATLGVLATNAISLGTAAAAGSAATVMRSDSTIVAFDTTIPSTLALGHTATAGSASVSSRRDHTHGTVDILLRVVTGQYTGDGAATLGVTGLGITPSSLVICKKSATGGNEQIYQTWSTMADDNAAGMVYAWGDNSTHGALLTDHVRSLDDGGFTVGDDTTQGTLNGSSTTYNYVAIGY